MIKEQVITPENLRNLANEADRFTYDDIAVDMMPVKLLREMVAALRVAAARIESKA